ncbi:vesicle transport through interaction with t-SNAREs homolog 1B-like [Ixodes scapularis]|uniref:vesicle transport through interaction with t-SNAREs homolog 1B-like n=1 Tax=Ixodes scapularis TaxID=6945 RepID=UPI001161780B|nr:vesicle transport through interaction with t-SNAREs homolog 1B-like [Ixodes scapularis]
MFVPWSRFSPFFTSVNATGFPLDFSAMHHGMSSEKFEYLEEDLRALLDDIKRKLDGTRNRLQSGESKKTYLREVQRKLDQANDVLQELQDEAHSAPNPYRIQMNAKTRKYRAELDDVNKAVVTLATSINASGTRQELLSPSTVIGDFGNDPQRSRLLQMNETLGRTTDALVRTFQVAAETDQVGVAVAEELRMQRESQVRTKERLEETDQKLTTSRKIQRTMYRRVITNKLILILIIIMEIIIFGGIVYWKFFMKK